MSKARPRGIERTPSGYRVRVTVGPRGTHRTRTRRFGPDATLTELRCWQDEARQALRDDPTTIARDTLAADVDRYLTRHVAHATNLAGMRAELRAWVALFGRLRRDQITHRHVNEARATWRAQGRSEKTLLNRERTLARLYRVLDGRKRRTPCDDVDPIRWRPAPAAVPSVQRVQNTVAALEALGTPAGLQLAARLRVLAASGVRPAELMRADPMDVDWRAQTWRVRTAKGGIPRTLWLTPDLDAALRALVHAEAWGPWDTSAAADLLRSVGWPPDLRPYRLRAAFGQALSAAGADLADVALLLGHVTGIVDGQGHRVTRQHYVPGLEGRLQATMALVGTRYGWTPPRVTARAAAGSSVVPFRRPE